MEEHPYKRRRVEQREDRPAIHHGLHRVRERGSNLANKQEKVFLPELDRSAQEDQAFDHLQPSTQQAQSPNEPANFSQIVPKIQVRRPMPTAPPQPASTMLAVAIDNGSGAVSQANVPVASKNVWVPGYGELTMTDNGGSPSTTAPAGLLSSNADYNPAAVTPPPAIAASQARDQALSTQEAMAKQLNVLPQPSLGTPVTPNAAASQSPMAMNSPESRSQQVLSTPSTPIPSTPQSSAVSSTSSYFSPSPSSMSPSISSKLSASPTSLSPSAASSSNPPPSTIIPNISQSPSTNNSTSSVATSTLTPISSTSISISSSVTTTQSSGTSISSVTSQDSITSTQLSASLASVSASESASSSVAALTSSNGFVTSTRQSQTSSLTSSSGTTFSSSTPSSLSSQNSDQSSSAFPTSTGATNTEAGPGVGAGSGSPTSTTSPTSSSSAGAGGSSAPPTPVLVGGIVGGVAGLTMILALLLLFLRWRRGKTARRRNISPPIPQTLGPGGVPQPAGESGNMTQRSSTTPIAGAGFFGRLRPASSQTATTADTAPSERGFQKISGRKLPSVLASGGDGWGNNGGAGPSSGPPGGPSSRGPVPGQTPVAGLAPALRPSSPHSLSGSSFYRDSRGFYGGVVPESMQAETDNSSSPSTSPLYPTPLGVAGRSPQGRGSPANRPPEVANIRPGPARTPVINQPGTIPMRNPSRANQPPPRPQRGTPPPQNPFRDGLGRSHPSQDGSRGSRFREDTTPP